MSTTEIILQRLSLAFADEGKRSLKAAALIINVGRLLPASHVYPLPPPSTSEERLDFIRFVLQKEVGIDYTCNEILAAHNILMGSDHTQEQLTFDCGIEKIQLHLTEYKRLRPQSGFARLFAPTLLLPHRTTCSVCSDQLKVIFQASATIVYCAKTQPCLLYKADCHRCRLSFRVSSAYLIDRKETLVTSESQAAEFVHYSGSLVFSKELLISFSSQLVDNHVTFDGFASATVKTYRRLCSTSVDLITSDNLTRSLQSVWLYYELTNFIMMTSKLTQISYPFAMAEGRTTVNGRQSSRAIFIERNLDWMYHLFTVFWSHHEDVFGACKCGGCSRALVLDGHQKPYVTDSCCLFYAPIRAHSRTSEVESNDPQRC